MADWLIHDGSVIVNAIVADSQEIAEEVTGLQAFPAPDNGVPWVGWVMLDGAWVESPPPQEPEPAPAPEE